MNKYVKLYVFRGRESLLEFGIVIGFFIVLGCILN